jgi:hypothetical protein
VLTQCFTAAGLTWSEEAHEFKTPAGIPLEILLAGEGSELLLPDPAEDQTTTERDGLPVLTLARLIESKLAWAEGTSGARIKTSPTWWNSSPAIG